MARVTTVSLEEQFDRYRINTNNRIAELRAEKDFLSAELVKAKQTIQAMENSVKDFCKDFDGIMG